VETPPNAEKDRVLNRFSTTSTESTGIGQGARGGGYSSAKDGAAAKPSGHHSLTTTTLACIECLRPWLVDSERWRLKVTDDEQRETVPYCPDCAAREFGPV
jgi:hypothetical protein